MNKIKFKQSSSLVSFKLGERFVDFTEFHVRVSTAGLLLGNPTVRFINKKINSHIENYHLGVLHLPLSIVPDPEMLSHLNFSIPHFEYELLMSSDPMDQKFDGSALKVYFYSDSSVLTHKKVIEIIAGDLHWETHAKDYLI